MGEVNVWVAPPAATSKSVFGSASEAVLQKLDPTQLNDSLKKLALELDQILKDVETKGGYRLKGIEIGLEITAEGGVNLIGTMTVGGKAALTLRFEKS